MPELVPPNGSLGGGEGELSIPTIRLERSDDATSTVRGAGEGVGREAHVAGVGAGEDLVLVRNRVMAAIGPKFSSAKTRMSSRTSVSTVGSIEMTGVEFAGANASRRDCAPSFTASATISSISFRRRALMSGPIWTRGSRPSPSFNALARSDEAFDEGVMNAVHARRSGPG